MAPEIKFADYLDQKGVKERLESFLDARKARMVEEVINIDDDNALQVFLVRGEPLVVLVAGRRHIWGPPRVEKIVASKQMIQKLRSAGIKTEAEVAKTGSSAKWVEAQELK